MTTPLGGISVSGTVDDADTPRDVLDLFALDAFVTGRQPFARSTQLENVAPGAVLLPPGARVLRETADDHCLDRFATGDGWTLRTAHWGRARRASVVVTATTRELAESVLATTITGAVETPSDTPDRVEIGFWHLAAHGPQRVGRDIDSPAWGQIRGNYSARVSTAVDTLMASTADTIGGRLLLLHGPPGTGKTTLLRSLARQWRSWCQVDCVLDPEVLFSNAGYLMEVALGDDSEGGPERWRLLLLEDCDELIRAEAKSSTGQALSRLLNLTDGLLGQGRNVLIAISTNEDLARLHPAVVRPGRALARLEVGRLSQAEATTWLAAPAHGTDAAGDDPIAGPPAAPPAIDRDGATLAELYGLRAGNGPISVVEQDEPSVGCYL